MMYIYGQLDSRITDLKIRGYSGGGMMVPENFRSYEQRRAENVMTVLELEPTMENATLLLLRLTDDQRRDVFCDFCTSCGSDDPTCQCWNDE